MRQLTRNLTAAAALSLLAATACVTDKPSGEAGPESAPTTTTTAPPGVEDGDWSGELGMDGDWKLKSVTGVGETELNSTDASFEGTIYRFNFELGDVAVSCLVATDSDEDFPDSGYIKPDLCFVDGDPTKPLSSLAQTQGE